MTHELGLYSIPLAIHPMAYIDLKIYIYYIYMGVSTQNGWFIIKMDDSGVPGTTIFGNIHIYVIYGRLMSKQISIYCVSQGGIHQAGATNHPC